MGKNGEWWRLKKKKQKVENKQSYIEEKKKQWVVNREWEVEERSGVEEMYIFNKLSYENRLSTIIDYQVRGAK